MRERHEQLQRALRTVKRSIEASDQSVHSTSDEAQRHLLAAVQQLSFVVEKLLEQLAPQENRAREG